MKASTPSNRFWSFFSPPSQRNLTKTQRTIDSGLGASLTFYSGPSLPSSQPPYCVKIHYKAGIRRATGMHWHERHTEYVRVERGRLLVWLDKEIREVGPEDGDIVIKPFTLHQYRPADSNRPEDEVIVWERTDPDDGTKEITFRTILSIFTDSPRVQSGASPSLPEILNLFLLFGQYDNYPVILPTHFVFLRRPATVAVLWLIEKLARVYGLRPTYREYVPDHLVEVMKTSERGRFKSQ